jgi:hypothetical protein
MLCEKVKGEGFSRVYFSFIATLASENVHFFRLGVQAV